MLEARPPRRSLAALLLAITVLSNPAAAQQLPAPVEHHDLATLTGALETSGRDYLPFLARRSLSCGLYCLQKGATDHQPTHDDDEIYFVVLGDAQLETGSGSHAVRVPATKGSILFVGAGVPHRFVEISEDLTTLVFFSHAKPTRGGMAAGPVPKEQTPYDESSERGNARIFYWFGNSSAGQVWIDYGRPAWNPAFARFLAKQDGKRWRFGENAWTSLDTNVPLTIGGVDLDVGAYYLVMANDSEHGMHLIALDPTAVRRARLDAYEAQETEGGKLIPLEQMADSTPAGRLDVTLEVDREHPDHARLGIAFGPHRYEAKVVMHP